MSNAESLRIAHLAKARERQKIDTEKQLQKIEEESRSKYFFSYCFLNLFSCV